MNVNSKVEEFIKNILESKGDTVVLVRNTGEALGLICGDMKQFKDLDQIKRGFDYIQLIPMEKILEGKTKEEAVQEARPAEERAGDTDQQGTQAT